MVLRVSECKLKVTSKVRHGRRVYQLFEPLTVYLHWNGGCGLNLNDRKLTNCRSGKGLVFIPANFQLSVFVPAEYETDLASIPRFCWPVIGPPDRYPIPAIVHDLACDRGLPRFVANSIFRWLLAETGVGPVRRCMLYYAVVFFGYRSPVAKVFQAVSTWFFKKGRSDASHTRADSDQLV